MNDEFDFDDIDNFDNFDDDPINGSIDGEGNDRNPVVSAGKSFAAGALEETKSVENIRKLLQNALPKGYSDALDQADKTATSAKDLYDKAAKELKPAVNDMKKALHGALPKIEDKVSEGVYEKLQGLLKTEEKKAQAKLGEDQIIASSIDQIFESQQELARQTSEEASARDALRSNVEQARFENTTDALGNINATLGRMLGYQERITASYQKKSLEISYRHYFASRDLLKTQQAGNLDIINALRAIQKNTGLPDWVKTQQGENFSQMLQERLMGGSVDSVSGYIQNYTGKFTENLTNKVMEQVGSVRDGLSGFADGLSAANDMGDMTDGLDVPGVGKYDMAANMAGGTLAGMLMGRIGKQLAPWLARNEKIARGGIAAGDFVSGLDGNFKEFMDRAGDSNNSVMQWFADLAPTDTTKNRIQHDYKATALQPTTWDMAARKSLVEIIPGFLSRITQHTESLATGTKAERLIYSADTESFMRFSDAASVASDRINAKGGFERFKDDLDKFVDGVLGNNVSDEAKSFFREQLRIDVRKGYNYNPKRYIDHDNFAAHIPLSAVDELVNFFVGETSDTSVAGAEKLSAQRSLFRGLRGSLPNVQEEIAGYAALGDKEILRELGWSTNTTGIDEFNEDKLNGILDGRVGTQYRSRFVDGEEIDFSALSSDDLKNADVKVNSSGLDRATMDNLTLALTRLTENQNAQSRFFEESLSENNLEVNAIQENGKILIEIRDLVQGIGTMAYAGDLPSGGSGEPSILNRLVGGLSDGISKAGGGLGSFYKSLGVGGLSLGGFAGRKVGETWEWLTTKTGEMDIYIAGMKRPALRANLLKSGRYVDVETGKVIESLKDITGAVQDMATGNIVITEEDFEAGLFNGEGKSIIGELGDKARSLAMGTGGLILDYYKGAGNLGVTAATFAKDTLTKFNRKLKAMEDVYLADAMHEGAKLTKARLRAGYYRNEDGSPIFSIDDINGGVYTPEGDVVLTYDEVQSGLVNKFGKPIQVAGILGTGLGLLGSGAAMGVAAGQKAFSTLKGLFKSRGDGEEREGVLDRLRARMMGGLNGVTNDMFVEASNVYIQGPLGDDHLGLGKAFDDLNRSNTDLYNLLDQRLTSGPSRTTTDDDGDGLRDGGWRSQLKEDQTLTLEDKGDSKEKRELEVPELGALGGLMGLLGLGGSEGGDDGGILETAADAADIADFLKGDKDDSGKSKKPSKGSKGGKGIFGKLRNKLAGLGSTGLATKAKSAGSSVAKFAKGVGGRFLGKQALKTGLATGAAAVGGTVAAPVVGAVLTAWTAWEAGTAAFGYARRRSEVEPLEDYRFTQYGIDSTNGDQIVAVRYLEEEVNDDISSNSVDLNVVLSKVASYAEGHMGDFNLDSGNANHREVWTTWFTKRFLPVFALHKVTANKLKRGTDILDVDDELPHELKTTFAQKAFCTPVSGQTIHPYSVLNSPFGGKITITTSDIQSRKQSLLKLYEKEEPGMVESALAWLGFGKDEKKETTTQTAKVSPIKKAAKTAGVIGLGAALAATPAAAGTSTTGAGVTVQEAVVEEVTELDPISLLRFQIYGTADPSPRIVAIYRDLEKVVFEDSEIRRGQFKWNGWGEGYFEDQFASVFGHDPNNPEDLERWITWLEDCMVPAFGRYLVGMNKVGQLRNWEDSTKLSNEAMSTIAHNLMFRVTNLDKRKLTGFHGEVPTARYSDIRYTADCIKRAAEEESLAAKVKMPTPKKTTVGIPTMLSPDMPQTTQKQAKSTVPAPPKGNITKWANLNDTLKRETSKSSSGLILPAEGRLSSKFGRRVHPVTGKTHGHGGIDIAAPTGTPILAAADGIISRRYLSKSYGNVIYMEHPDGKHTRYAHLSRFADGLVPGQEVKQGDVIGFMGSTGVSTGPHLHFEVRNGPTNDYDALDPQKFLTGDEAKKAKKIADQTEKDGKEEIKLAKVKDTLEGSDTLISTATGDATQAPVVGDGKVKPLADTTELNRARVAQQQTSYMESQSVEMAETNRLLQSQLETQVAMKQLLGEIAENTKEVMVLERTPTPKEYKSNDAKSGTQTIAFTGKSLKKAKKTGEIPVSMKRS